MKIKHILEEFRIRQNRKESTQELYHQSPFFSTIIDTLMNLVNQDPEREFTPAMLLDTIMDLVKVQLKQQDQLVSLITHGPPPIVLNAKDGEFYRPKELSSGN